MNKKVKSSIFILLTAIVAVVTYLNYQTYFSEAARKGNKNVENIKKLSIGMTVDSVVIIMGSPETINDPVTHSYPYTQYNYPTNDESFAYVSVILDSTMRVRELHYPK